MEIKPWDQYSFSQKRILLNFWFGTVNRNSDMITKEDRESFNCLLEKDIDLIMDFVVALTMLGYNSKTMLVLMRDGTLEDTLDELPRMEQNEDYQFMKKQVITMLVGLCNITMKTTDEQEIVADAAELAIETRKEIIKHFS